MNLRFPGVKTKAHPLPDLQGLEGPAVPPPVSTHWAFSSPSSG